MTGRVQLASVTYPPTMHDCSCAMIKTIFALSKWVSSPVETDEKPDSELFYFVQGEWKKKLVRIASRTNRKSQLWMAAAPVVPVAAAAKRRAN